MAEKLMKYADAVKQFDPVIGLETHVELSTNTKLFCPAHVEFGGDPNTQLTPVSLGLPGSLPVLNEAAVDYAIKLGLALHCEIAEWSQFSRKNYFYPDMPRNYQISQYDKPTNGNGYLDVELDDGTIFRVPIERAHIEDDAGKNTHVGGADGRIEGADHSLVDYNRAGVPLIEIVTKPIEGVGDRGPEIAGAYMRTLRDIVRALNISHARMEQGNMRADVNVSLRRNPTDPFGTRSETKNVNSFRGIEKTIQYEIRRQAAILNDGGEVLQETRHWDEASQTTAGGRVKSDADDYRYFPDSGSGDAAHHQGAYRAFGRADAGDAARTPQPPAGRVGLLRPGDARRGQRRRSRPDRGHRGRRRQCGRRQEVVAGRALP